MRYQSTTGLSPVQITELAGRVHQVLSSMSPVKSGRPAVLGLRSQICLVLVMLRQNLTQHAVGDLFGVSQSTVHRIYTRLAPVLLKVLAFLQEEPATMFSGRVLLVDGTLIPTGNRPGMKHNYSGKRHRQGVNIQIASTVEGTLLAVSDLVPGCRHDRRALTETGWEQALQNVEWIADPAYQGTTAHTPVKKRRGANLSKQEKDLNRQISSIRSAIERCIAHLKNWKVLAHGYRGPLTKLPAVITLITKLEHYRLSEQQGL